MNLVNKSWKLLKTVLPQHTDHSGVIWHGAYQNFLEEGRIDALDKVGLSYSKLSEKGFEIPVFSIELRCKRSFIHEEKVIIESKFKLKNKRRLTCKTLFLKSNVDIGAIAIVGIVFVKQTNELTKLVRELPIQIKNLLSLLEKGPKIYVNV